LPHFVSSLGGDIVDDGDDDGGNNIYKGRAEPVLILLSDSYSNNEISICDSRLSFCSAYMFYWLFLFDYCLVKST